MQQLGIASPFATAFSVPLEIETLDRAIDQYGRDIEDNRDWWMFLGYLVFTSAQNATLLVIMIWLFNTRWRVSG